MIKGITGIPGSGKSYFAVKLITDKFYKWDDKLLEWVPKNNKQFTIFSNVDGLKLPHISLSDYFTEKEITYEKFFTVPFFTEAVKKYGHIIILLDEAQKFFPSNYSNNDVLFFFQYHRHLGVDIILTFQTWFSITRKITDLMEFEIRAVRRSFSIVGEFRYHYYFGNERHGGKKLQPDHKVFALYKSFELPENEKPPRPAKKLVFFIIILLIVFFVGWKMFLGMFRAPNSNVTKKTVSVENQHPSSIQASGDPLPGDALAAPVPSKSVSINSEIIVNVTRVQLGGFWYGHKLIAVDFFGNLVNIDDFQYQYKDDYDNHRVWVYVPDNILAQIKTAKSDENSVNGFYQTGENTYSRIGENASNNQQIVQDDLSTTGYRVIDQ